MIKSKPLSTRDKLFAAAVRVFAQKGFQAATVREICNLAGSANINSISYYFGSKENLYFHILELLFAKYDTYEDLRQEDMVPEKRLHALISVHCDMLYRKSEFSEDLTSIYIAEMAKPSVFLEELIKKYNRPRVEKNLAMVRELLGPEAPPDMVRNCLVSIIGQVLYYAQNRPVFRCLFPDHRDMAEEYRNWVEHVYQFSLGGIEALKRQLKTQVGKKSSSS